MRQRLLILATSGLLSLAACPAPETEAPASRTADAWRAMVEREEALQALGPALRELDRSVMNLVLPDPPARARFAPAVVADDLEAPVWGAAGRASPFQIGRVPVQSNEVPLAPMELGLWSRLFATIDYFRHAKFSVVDGRFLDLERRRLETRIAFAAAARLRDGRSAALRTHLDVVWARSAASEATDSGAWRIASWSTGDFEIQEAQAPFFREVLDAAIPDPEALRRARRSRHEELAAARLADPDDFRPPHRHFFVGSQDRHPGVSVVDVNADELDDVYVMARWGANQLFVNRGDGTFEERADELGLALEDHSAAAIFADFDNDGDPDAFVGRTLHPSVYLENRKGHFVDRSADALGGAPLPALVSSLAAADVDGDGLLDLYVSTYAAQMLVAELVAEEKARRQGVHPGRRLLEAFLDADDAERLYAATSEAEAHEFLSLPGPPNRLLRNLGGGSFEELPGGTARTFRNTYQASFADYDRDGDPDLYLAHDFSPNQLLRNEGRGSFSDATGETGTPDVGFGMGVAWGDYDHDGLEDLYVSNMYSKAGRRITRAFEAGDPRLAKMARGNTLFRNAGKRFEVVSGLAPPALRVEAAGWSWGSQFLDVDADGFLDLFALSGYYTAPTDIESFVDI